MSATQLRLYCSRADLMLAADIYTAEARWGGHSLTTTSVLMELPAI